MVRILLSTAVVSFAGCACAADLPTRMVAPQPYAAAQIFTWTGFHLGLNAGLGFNNKRDDGINTVGLAAPNNFIYDGGRKRDSGLTGGVSAGYNLQFGSVVAGVEGDVHFINRSRGGSGAFPAPADLNTNFPAQPIFDDRTDFALQRPSASNWFGTLRGRLGFAFDRMLIFGTGGIAFSAGSGSSSITQRDYYENPLNNDPVNLQGPNGTFTQTLRALSSTSGSRKTVGLALGGGVEYALTNAISLKLEYLHVNLGQGTRTFTTLVSPAPGARSAVAGQTMTAGNQITVTDQNNFDVGRIGVNFRF